MRNRDSDSGIVLDNRILGIEVWDLIQLKVRNHTEESITSAKQSEERGNFRNFLVIYI